MLPSVKIEDIEAVIKVAECRHFTRAGQELHRHQTAVTRSAERVESGLGVKLFDRSSHPIQPTRAGVAFSYWARKSVYALERAIMEGLRASDPEASVLQVGYTSYLDLDVLAYLENVAKSPDAGFSHQDHSSSSSEVIASVLSGKWDCGFIVNPATTGGLVGVPVYQDPFGVALASDHPLARKRKVSIDDLRDLPLILPARERNTGFRTWFIERCGADSVKLKIAQEVANPNEAWFLASQHAGAALMPRASTKNLTRGATVFRSFAEEDLFAEIQLVFRDEPQPPMLASFVDAVLRMKERMRRGELRHEPRQGSNVQRPVVKPWKRSPAVHWRSRIA
jgi:DNA-binding transcriptional LysR family regulator